MGSSCYEELVNLVILNAQVAMVGSTSMIGLEKCLLEGISLERYVFLTSRGILGWLFEIIEHVSISVGMFGFGSCFLYGRISLIGG